MLCIRIKQRAQMFLGIKDQSVSITSALTLKSTRVLCVGEADWVLQQGRGMGVQVN